jgi:hypothetical protein
MNPNVREVALAAGLYDYKIFKEFGVVLTEEEHDAFVERVVHIIVEHCAEVSYKDLYDHFGAWEIYEDA